MEEKFSPLQFKLPQVLKLTLKCQRAVKCFLWHRRRTSFIPHSVYSRLPCGVQIAVRTQSTQWNSGAQIVHSKFEVFFVRTWVFFGKVCFDFTKSQQGPTHGCHWDSSTKLPGKPTFGRHQPSDETQRHLPERAPGATHAARQGFDSSKTTAEARVSAVLCGFRKTSIGKKKNVFNTMPTFCPCRERHTRAH